MQLGSSIPTSYLPDTTVPPFSVTEMDDYPLSGIGKYMMVAPLVAFQKYYRQMERSRPDWKDKRPANNKTRVILCQKFYADVHIGPDCKFPAR